MSKGTHTYKVQAGDEVHARWVGTEITYTTFSLPEEMVANGHAADLEAVAAAANRDRNILVNRAVRKVFANENATLEEALAAAEKVQIGRPRAPSTGGRKPKDPARAAAQSAGNRSLEVAASDPEKARRLISLGAITQSELDAYVAARQTAASAPTETPAPRGKKEKSTK